MHTVFLKLAATSRTDWTAEQLEDIKEADRMLDAPDQSLMEGPARERVLNAVRAGYSKSSEIAAATGLPPKSISAWLSVLNAHGEVIKVSEVRESKRGPPTFLYEATGLSPEVGRGMVSQ